jgi:hypothetical protein
MASLVWFVFMAYSWYLSFKALGKVASELENRAGSFHLAAWSVPLVLTIIVLALGLVDAYPLYGICFVGGMEHYPTARIALLLAPISVALLAAGFFLARSLLILVKLKFGSEEVISQKAHSKLSETIVRFGLSLGIGVVSVVLTFIFHIHEWNNAALWEESDLDYWM